MKIQIISVAALIALATAACGATPDSTEGQSASTTEAVTSTGTAAGVWHGNTGAEYVDVVLDTGTDSAGHYEYFIEEQAELISCKVGSGCTTTHERENGTYSATATHLTLKPSTGAERVYSYTRNGNTLSLTRDGSTSTYSRVNSYCDTAVDCPEEGAIRSECDSPTAGWECNANQCSWACSGAK